METRMMQLNKHLCFYRERGLSVIPIPYKTKAAKIKWEEYQKRRATEAEIESWFGNNSINLAIVCGEVSANLVVVDCDTEEKYFEVKQIIEEKLSLDNLENHTPVVKTGKGYHIYFRTATSVKSVKFPRLDIKGEGGYVLAPPSIHPNGSSYSFVNSNVTDILSIASMADIGIDVERKPNLHKSSQPNWVSEALQGVAEGERNDTCFRLAGYFKEHLPQDISEQTLLNWNQQNKPPLPEREIKTAVESAYNYIAVKPLLDNINSTYTEQNSVAKALSWSKQNDSRSEKGTLSKSPLDYTKARLARQKEHLPFEDSNTNRYQSVIKSSSIDWGEVRAFMQDNAGKAITYEQIDREFGITSKGDKGYRRLLVIRLVGDGKAEKLGPGKFRLYDDEIQEFNPKRRESLEPIDIVLPLGLSAHLQLYTGNAISYEGDTDAGKTLLAIETAKLNLDKFNWHYWWAETGPEEFYARTADYLGLPNPHFHLYERDENFVDCIRRFPDDCHICDYVGRLEGEWNLLGSDVAKMISALKRGFLVINLQSNPLTGFAFGGVETRHRCRLCLKLTLDKQSGITTVRAEKAKTPKRGIHSIRGYECKFQPKPEGVGIEITRDWEQGH